MVSALACETLIGYIYALQINKSPTGFLNDNGGDGGDVMAYSE